MSFPKTNWPTILNCLDVWAFPNICPLAAVLLYAGKCPWHLTIHHLFRMNNSAWRIVLSIMHVRWNVACPFIIQMYQLHLFTNIVQQWSLVITMSVTVKYCFLQYKIYVITITEQCKFILVISSHTGVKKQYNTTCSLFF